MKSSQVSNSLSSRDGDFLASRLDLMFIAFDPFKPIPISGTLGFDPFKRISISSTVSLAVNFTFCIYIQNLKFWIFSRVSCCRTFAKLNGWVYDNIFCRELTSVLLPHTSADLK
jgi:hypothetical protein